MIGLYYAILAIVSVPLYVFSIILKEKKMRIGMLACYAILFLIVLLFV